MYHFISILTNFTSIHHLLEIEFILCNFSGLAVGGTADLVPILTMTNGKDGGGIASGSSQLSDTEIKFRCNVSAFAVTLLAKDGFAYQIKFQKVQGSKMIYDRVSLCCWTEPSVITDSNSPIIGYTKVCTAFTETSSSLLVWMIWSCRLSVLKNCCSCETVMSLSQKQVEFVSILAKSYCLDVVYLICFIA